MLPAWRCVQTFLTAHELSLCLHSSAAVFGKCHLKLSAFDGIDEYSLIYSAFYQLLNALLVNRTDAVFHLVPVFTGAVKRILSSQTCHMCVYTLYLQIVEPVYCCLLSLHRHCMWFSFSVMVLYHIALTLIFTECKLSFKYLY